MSVVEGWRRPAGAANVPPRTPGIAIPEASTPSGFRALSDPQPVEKRSLVEVPKVPKPGRLSHAEQARRERRLLQYVAAGYGWSDASQRAGVTAAAALRLIDRLGVGLPPHVQLEVLR